jgi:hypothetical protein
MKFDKKMGVLIVLMVLTVAAVGIIGVLKKPVLINSPAEDLEVTVYNSNLGVVKEYRTNYLDSGLNTVLYEGVASSIDPSSVKLKSLNGNIEVLEQNFQYDIVSKEKILEKYVGKDITAYQIYGDKKELIEGTLLSYSGDQLVLRDMDGKINILSVNSLVLPDLPEGLITKPTLEWQIDSKEAKNQTLELSYMTGGMSWNADYVAVTNDNDDKLDLNGWVTVKNNAGTTFNNVSLKLIAGDVHRTSAATPSIYMEDVNGAYKTAGVSSQFQEQTLFDYHMYDLQRRTTLKDNEEKQLSLMSANGIGVEKEYVYDDIQNWYWYGSSWSDNTEKKVDVMLNYNNSEANNLGIPLPKGTVKIFKKDASGKLQFIGEDAIDHTPKDETIRLLAGQAFDIVGERKQMGMKDLGGYYEYTWEVTLRNHKSGDITVSVLENTAGDWEITKENIDHVKESNNKIKWKVPVKANSEAKLTYTIRYKK